MNVSLTFLDEAPLKFLHVGQFQLQRVALEELDHLVQDHGVQRVLLVLQTSRQASLDLLKGFRRFLRDVRRNWIVLDEGDPVRDVQLDAPRHPVHNRQQPHFQTGTEILVRAFFVDLIHLPKIPEHVAAPRRSTRLPVDGISRGIGLGRSRRGHGQQESQMNGTMRQPSNHLVREEEDEPEEPGNPEENLCIRTTYVHTERKFFHPFHPSIVHPVPYLYQPKLPTEARLLFTTRLGRSVLGDRCRETEPLFGLLGSV